MMDAQTLQRFRLHLARHAPRLDGGYRQSRRLEGVIDRGGECRRYGTVHIWVEQGLDGRQPEILQTIQEVLRVQHRDTRDSFSAELRGFSQSDVGADQVRIPVGSTQSSGSLAKRVTDVAAGTVPANGLAVRSRPARDDLVLILSKHITTRLPPEVNVFAPLANQQRTLHVGLDDGAWCILGPMTVTSVEQPQARTVSAKKESEMNKYVESLNRQVCEYLWAMSSEVTGAMARDEPPSPNMIWPGYRDGDGGPATRARCSEQEARFAMALVLSRDPSRYFSIETPTNLPYQFSGDTALSAQTDLTIFRRDGDRFSRDVNVELKAHQATQVSIDKDIRKLLEEDIAGNWFHLVKHSDRLTLQGVFGKLVTGFEHANDPVNVKPARAEPVDHELPIFFCICCVGDKQPWAVFARFTKAELLQAPKTCFGPDDDNRKLWVKWTGTPGSRLR